MYKHKNSFWWFKSVHVSSLCSKFYTDANSVEQKWDRTPSFAKMYIHQNSVCWFKSVHVLNLCLKFDTDVKIAWQKWTAWLTQCFARLFSKRCTCSVQEWYWRAQNSSFEVAFEHWIFFSALTTAPGGQKPTPQQRHLTFECPEMIFESSESSIGGWVWALIFF